MSGWIKVEKDLSNDPRVLRMASRLSHADVTLGSRSRLVVVGALVTLWWYADTHIGDEDVLPIGADQVDELVGLKGFCELMPSNWLQILDADHVKLVDYTAHNGSSAKNRALNQKRQERHRAQPTSTSRSRHAPVTQGALPDKTRLIQDKTPEERERRAREAPDVLVPRETNVHPHPTRSAAEIWDTLCDDWKRDVPEANAEAFQRWIIHNEKLGKRLGADQRLAQARHLATQGDAGQQCEVVDWCIGQAYRTLIPYRDVRHRKYGREEAKTHTPSLTTAELEAREAAHARG